MILSQGYLETNINATKLISTVSYASSFQKKRQNSFSENFLRGNQKTKRRMLELVLSKLIAHYLKEYIQKIDSSQMETKIWKGQATFDNLDLLPTAFTSHQIPLYIKKGVISHVNLNFPWKKLNSEACIIEIKDVYIVCTPDGSALIKKDLQAKEDAIHIDESSQRNFTQEDAKGTWQSLTNTIIDNARIDIENIHVRIEIPSKNSNYSLGFIIPRISMNTVDENNMPIRVMKRFNVLRKLLIFERLSIYFDIFSDSVPIDDSFLRTMINLMKSQHQFIMSPLTVEFLLIHTRNNPKAIQNQLVILTKDILFSLDFLQCRSVLELNKRWQLFSIQRKYAHCLRPVSFESMDDNWLYAHRCAISRAFPHIFKPDLALVILLNRKKYLKNYRKANHLPNPSTIVPIKNLEKPLNSIMKPLKIINPINYEQSLEKLENKIGPQASFFLRQFAETVTRKEKKEMDSNLSAFDMSELKGLINSTDQFFKSSSFSIDLNIPSFKLGLNYSIDQPLFSVEFVSTIGQLKSTENEISFNCKIENLLMNCYNEGQVIKIFQVNLNQFTSFLDLQCSIPTNTNASTLRCDLAPVLINLDTKVLTNTSDFFANFQSGESSQKVLDSENENLVILDVAEQFQKLTTFRNYSMNVCFHQITFVFPFVMNEKQTELRLGISDFGISKELNEVIQPDAISYNLPFHTHLTIDQFQFAGLPLFSSFTTHFYTSVTFYQRHTNIDVNIQVVLDDISFYMMNFDYKKIMDTVHAIMSLEIFSLSTPEPISNSKTILSFTKTKFDFQFLVKELMVQMKDDINDTKLYIRQMSNKSAIFKTQSEFSFIIKSLISTNNDKQTLELINNDELSNDGKCCQIDINKTDYHLHFYNSTINVDFQWIKWIQNYITNFINSIFNTDTQNEPKANENESKSNENQNIGNADNLEEKECEIYITFHKSQFVYNDPTGDVIFPFSVINISQKDQSYFAELQDLSIKHNDLILLEPSTFNCQYIFGNDEHGSKITSTIPLLACSITPASYHALMRLIFDLKDYLRSDSENETKKEKDQINKTNISILGLKIHVFDTTLQFGEIDIGQLAVNVEFNSIFLKTVVSINDFQSQQWYQDGFIDLIDLDHLDIIYAIDETSLNKISIDLPMITKNVNFRIPVYDYFIQFIRSDQYDKPSTSISKYEFNISCLPTNINFYGKSKSILTIEVGQTTFSLVIENDLDFELRTEKLGLITMNHEKLIEIPDEVTFSYKNNCYIFHVNEIQSNLNLISIMEMSDQLSNDSVQEEASATTSTLSYGIDFAFNTINISIIPPKSEVDPLLFQINQFHCLLKYSTSYQFATLFIKSIEMNLDEKSIEPTRISEIRFLVSFNDSFDLTSETHESLIEKAIVNSKDSVDIQKVNLGISIKSVHINYSHRLATTLISCFMIPNTNASNNTESKQITMDIKGNFIIDEFEIVLWLLKPIATFNIIGLSASRTDRWNAVVKRVDIFSERRSLLKSQEGKDLFTFHKEKDTFCVLFNEETELFFDDKFILQLTSFIMWSPFLHISSTSDQTSSAILLPFNVVIFIPKFCFVIPTEFNTILHIDFGLSLKFIQTEIDAAILGLSAYFSNNSGKNKYQPMIDDFSINANRKIDLETNNESINLTISNIKFIVSALDISMFTKIYQSISKTYQSLLFSVDSSSNNTLGFTSIKFTSGELNVVICRDNRSSQMFDPLFKLSVAPISFLLKAKNESSDGNIFIDIELCIQYFNETSGRWDMIIEPFSLRALLFLRNQVFHASIVAENEINISLPTTAIIQYMNLYNDIDSSLSKRDTQSMTYPKFLLQNCLDAEMFTAILPLNSQIEPEYFDVGPGQIIPVYNLYNDSKIQINVTNIEPVIFTPQQLTYPTYLSHMICVCKKPYKGGILIQVNTAVQLFNGTSMNIDLYIKMGREYQKLATILPNQRYPLSFSTTQSSDFLFVEHDQKPKSKLTPIKISPTDDKPTTFQFWHGDELINLIKTMSDDSVSGYRVVLILPYFIASNHLPLPVFLLYNNTIKKESELSKSQQKGILEIPARQQANLLFISSKDQKINSAITLDMSHFAKINGLSLTSPEVQSVHIFDSNVTSFVDVGFIFDQDKETGQIIMNIFSPFVFFNTTNMPIQIIECSSQIKEHRSLTISPGSPGLWCPPSFIQESTTLVNIRIPGVTTDSIKPFDCNIEGRSVIFLPSINKEQLFTPLRYNVNQKERTSVITFSSFITVTNELETTLCLQPILSIPKSLTVRNDHENDDCFNGLASKSLQIGDSIEIKPNETAQLETMTLSGSFLLAIRGYSTTPAISLISPQKTAFRIMSHTKVLILEFEVSDTKTSYVSFIRKRQFPTPFLLANCLDYPIEAYHVIPLNPFHVDPHSTSIYAFDEPYSYPHVHIDILDSNSKLASLFISLVDDSETMELDTKLNDRLIYLTIQPNSNGTRSIILSQEAIPQLNSGNYEWFFSLSLHSVHISIIDLLMREFALITMNNLSIDSTIFNDLHQFSVSLDSFQIDDQHPLSQCPVVLYGRKSGHLPFFHLISLSPSGSKMDNFFYVNINMQRVDLSLDASFISDCAQMAIGLVKPIETAIAPVEAHLTPSDSIIHVHWLEISPIYIVAQYKGGSSKRTPLMGPIPWYINLIPSVNSAKITLPGLIISHLTERFNEIQEKIIEDYKFAAFKQIISILGVSGKIMTAFGITDSLIRLLQIRIHSDLVDFNSIQESHSKPKGISFTKSMALLVNQFDNRKEIVAGFFNHYTLMTLKQKVETNGMTISNTIKSLLNGNTDEQNLGMQIKMIPGCGFGHGVFGILTKSRINRMENINPMADVNQIRMPRAYPNNHIGKYDSIISKAQLIISKFKGTTKGNSLNVAQSMSYISDSAFSPYSSPQVNESTLDSLIVSSHSLSSSYLKSSSVNVSFEKIRMKIICQVSRNLICLTDSTIYIINPDVTNIEMTMNISDIENIRVRGTNIEVSRKQRRKVLAFCTNSEDKARRVSTFLSSQKRMIQIFKASLLE